jgi:hypothetical protein
LNKWKNDESCASDNISNNEIAWEMIFAELPRIFGNISHGRSEYEETVRKVTALFVVAVSQGVKRNVWASVFRQQA